MDEHRSGEGGAANTPPFPRIVPNDPPAAERSTEEDSEASEEQPERPSGISNGSPLNDPDIRPSPAGAAAPGAEHDRRPPETDPGHMLPPTGATADTRRQRRPNRAFEEIADRLEEAAERLDGLVEAQLAPAMGGRPIGAARAATAAIEDAADYLRSSDLASIREDLTRQVQEKPLRTLLLAVGTGWLAGKILR